MSTMQAHLQQLLVSASGWAADAVLRIDRGDRIDALDSIACAEQRLNQARDVIRESLVAEFGAHLQEAVS